METMHCAISGLGLGNVIAGNVVYMPQAERTGIKNLENLHLKNMILNINLDVERKYKMEIL